MREKSKIIVPLLIFFTVFFVYLHTLNPVFHADDSPETAACSYTLGIQHPPGYPLPTLMGKISTFLPFASAGFRVNMQAAFFGSLLAVLVFFIIMDVLWKKEGAAAAELIPAAAASLAFAFSYTLWNQSLSSKGGIYTMNACMLAFIILMLFRWERTKDRRYFYTASFMYGLSLGNHWESMAAALPALAVFIVMVFLENAYYKAITWKRIFTAFTLSFSGVFIYVYLIIRANGGAFLNWGDPVDLKQLFWVVTRAQYTAAEQASGMRVIVEQLGRIGRLMLFELSPAGLILAAAGVYCFLKAGIKKRFVMLCVLLISVLFGLAGYLNLKSDMMWVMDVFLLPAYMVMAVLLGAGMHLILKAASVAPRNKGGSVAVIFGLLSLAAFALPAYLCVSNYHRADQSRNFYAYDLGMNIIKSVEEPGSIAMLEGDFAVLPQMYFRYVEKRAGFCPVTTILLNVPWGVKNLRNECPGIKLTVDENAPLKDKVVNIVESNYKESAIYASVFRESFQKSYPQANAMLVPSGMAMKFSFDRPKTLRRGLEKLRILSYRNLDGREVYMDDTTSLGVSNYSSIFMETGNALSAAGLDEMALSYLTRAVQLATEQTRGISYTHLGIQYTKMKQYEKAEEIYRTAIRLGSVPVEAYTNLAGIYNNEKRYDESIELCEKALKIKPSDSDAFNNLALAYYYKENLGKAVELLEKAVSADPGNSAAVQNLSIIKGIKK